MTLPLALELADGEPPHMHVPQLKALFLIATQPAPASALLQGRVR